MAAAHTTKGGSETGDGTTVAVGTLERAVRDVLSATGLPEEHQRWVADGLIQADLRGVSTHGVIRLEPYVAGWQSGSLNVAPSIDAVTASRGAVSVFDGDRGIGIVVGRVIMTKAIEAARGHGIGLVSARNSNHAGMLAQYVLQAADAGMLGFFVSNGPPLLPPYGGRDPVLFNNPFAYAVPASRNAPIVLDMACSTVARGSIRLAAKEGRPIPEGWALGADGAPTTDPLVAMDGVLLPMAGHKGSAVAVINECLAALLSGATFSMGISSAFLSADASAMDHWGAGHTAIAVDLSHLGPAAETRARVDELIAAIKASRRAQGVSEILYPGEREARLETRYRRDGVPLGSEAARSLARVCAAVGVACPI